jgi:uncharacterized protein YbaR (Trm112 family)
MLVCDRYSSLLLTHLLNSKDVRPDAETPSSSHTAVGLNSPETSDKAPSASEKEPAAPFADLVCPLSKAPLQCALVQANMPAYSQAAVRATLYRTSIKCLLTYFACCRFSESTSELLNVELGVAYPVREGIPVLIPRLGRTFEVE